MKAIGILIAPDGEEWFDAYGPMTKDREQATRFISAEVAARAANRRFGRHNDAFWDSERTAQRKAAEEYRRWTYRVEEVAD
jgi:hypothetical protein